MGAIVVINNSSGPIHVFISKYSNSNGSDEWYVLEAGKRDSWARNGWEVVAFKNGNDTNRSGRYVEVNSTVTFNNLGDIKVN